MTGHRIIFSLMLVLAMLAGETLMAQKSNRSYAVQKNGMKIEGRITATETGRIQVMMQNGNTVSLNPGQYQYVVTPKPDDVEKLETLLDEGSYNQLTSLAPGIFETYKFLGWGDLIARFQVEGLLALNRKEEADKFLAMARRYPRENGFNITSAEVLLLASEGKLDQVEKKLSGVLAADDDAATAFTYMMRGRVEELSGRKKEAVLQYLKVVLLFEDRKGIRAVRKQARTNALRLMKELGDPSVQILENIK